ncbi:MAG: phospholipase D-like domain-containing protein, partial [Ferruginibacter sp.]
AIRDVITKITKDKDIFVYGISDKKVGGIFVQKADGNVEPVYPSALVTATTPEPFHSEPTAGGGTRMHHKFIVLDFNKPSARVYMGSYNFSSPADISNGENLLLIKDRRIATSYMIQALSIFDHYEFRLAQKDAKKAQKTLALKRPPAKGEAAWWEEDYKIARKIHDRELFS